MANYQEEGGRKAMIPGEANLSYDELDQAVSREQAAGHACIINPMERRYAELRAVARAADKAWLMGYEQGRKDEKAKLPN